MEGEGGPTRGHRITISMEAWQRNEGIGETFEGVTADTPTACGAKAANDYRFWRASKPRRYEIPYAHGVTVDETPLAIAVPTDE